MLYVYGHYKYFYSYSAEIDFSRQNLTSTDVRSWRLKLIPALSGLRFAHFWSQVKQIWIIEVVDRSSETQLQVVEK